MAEASQESPRDMSEDDDKRDQVGLLDLPEEILIKILGYTDHDFLRYVASYVSLDLRKVAHSQVLWKNACLFFSHSDCWEDSTSEKFVNDMRTTPYLYHLSVDFRGFYVDGKEEVIEALLNTHCKIYRLSIQVDVQYRPEWSLIIKRHPEIKELILADDVIEHDVFLSTMAATVGSLLPRLIRLDITNSHILQFFETGKLLSAPFSSEPGPDEDLPDWFPAEDSIHTPDVPSYPSELEESLESCLDLREPDSPEKEKQRSRKRGLRQLIFKCSDDIEDPERQIISENLADLILAHRESLEYVNILLLDTDKVFPALGETSNLVTLSLVCDYSGEEFILLLEKLSARRATRVLRNLRIHFGAGAGVNASSITFVLEKLAACHLPSLESLQLKAHPLANLTALESVFPGFAPFSGLLLDRPGRAELPTLREIYISGLGPVGRREFEELAKMSRARHLPLKVLDLHGVVCSKSREWTLCRERTTDLFRTTLSFLELYIIPGHLGTPGDDRYDAGFVNVRLCDCEPRPGSGDQSPHGWGPGGSAGRRRPASGGDGGVAPMKRGHRRRRDSYGS